MFLTEFDRLQRLVKITVSGDGTSEESDNSVGDEVLSANDGTCARPADAATEQRSIRVSRVSLPK